MMGGGGGSCLLGIGYVPGTSQAWASITFLHPTAQEGSSDPQLLSPLASWSKITLSGH